MKDHTKETLSHITNLREYDGEDLQKGDIMTATFGGSVIVIVDHKTQNPPEHLSKVRVSKKIVNGVYEISPEVELDIATARKHYMLKKADVFMILPGYDKRTFVGAVTQPTPKEAVHMLLAQLREKLVNPHVGLLIRHIELLEEGKFGRLILYHAS